MEIKTFELKSLKVSEFLKWSETGVIKLPFFQRSFVWQDSDMKSFIASLLLGLPIGSFLILNDPEDTFESRNIEHLSINDDYSKNKAKENYFLLDGQQRLTCINHIFNYTRLTKKEKRWFIKLELFFCKNENQNFNNLKEIEPEEIEESYIIVKKKKISKKENIKQSSFIQECIQNGIFPLDMLNNQEDGDAVFEILLGFAKNKISNDIQAQKWVSNIKEYLSSILKIEIPTIFFTPDEFGRAIQSFERINQAGIKLHIFDLFIARAERKGEKKEENNDLSFYNIILNAIQKNFEELELSKIINNDYKIDLKSWNISNFIDIEKDDSRKNIRLPSIFKDQIVDILTLLIFRDKSLYVLNENEVLKLDVQESSQLLNKNAEEAITKLIRAYCFLQLRCGVSNLKDLRYKLISLPIAFCMDDNIWNDSDKINLIEAWYWSTIFSGKYDYNQSNVTKKEISNLKEILIGNRNINITYILSQNKEVNESNEYIGKTDFENLKKMVRGALHDSLMQYILSLNPSDFIQEHNSKIRLSSFKKNQLEIHHILPLSEDKTLEISTKELRADKKCVLNSVLNKTYVSKDSNRKIGPMNYEKYKKHIEDDILNEHCIKFPNDFKEQESFLKMRYQSIKSMIIEEIKKLTKDNYEKEV